MPFVDDAELNDFEDDPIPVIGSDLLRGFDEEEEPTTSGPTAIKKSDEELPPSVGQFGDEPAEDTDEGNGLGDQETEDDEDIPSEPLDIDEPTSSKKSGRRSLEASRGSTPKTPKSAKSAKVTTSASGRKRKGDAVDEPAPKRSGRGRATAAAASEAIKAAAAKRPKAASGTKVPKATGAKRGRKPGSKAKKDVVEKPAEDPELEDFEVEEIRDIKNRGKHTEKFLVKWKGYPEAENTWEPRENLAENAEEILKEYEATLPETKTKEEKAAPAKKAAGAKKTKAKTATKKVAPAKKVAKAKPATTSRSRAGRPKRG